MNRLKADLKFDKQLKMMKIISKNKEILKVKSGEKKVLHDLCLLRVLLLEKIITSNNANNFNFRLIGIDANSFTINYAKKLSLLYPNISYLSEDVFNEKFKNYFNSNSYAY